ncbi:hypothetical protein [Actibacterium lipolyticum]|uniref:hypothetical protein n=1 Tax=Actibacterium lipolyticum TaxID=1524263 RepID=UPI001594FBB5|nr:hypothetical protein [Actibacterium lipolyticum]
MPELGNFLPFGVGMKKGPKLALFPFVFFPVGPADLVIDQHAKTFDRTRQQGKYNSRMY